MINARVIRFSLRLYDINFDEKNIFWTVYLSSRLLYILHLYIFFILEWVVQGEFEWFMTTWFMTFGGRHTYF